MAKPVQGSYPSFYETYISQVNETDLSTGFEKQRDLVNNFFDTISEENAGNAYAPGKWTIKELLQHVIDAERIFAYRALAFSRKEIASLPSFDENSYADNSHANERTWKSLTDELKTVRMSTEMLFNSFNTDMLNHSGIASNHPVTVNAFGFIILGHLYHHKKIIDTRYL